jgi:hypothetical protein
MAQGLFIWLITLLMAYALISLLKNQYPGIDKRFLIILFFYHSLLALAYYLYALFNPSDSKQYYAKIISDYRGNDWVSFYGTSTEFIEFVGYPFIKFLGFTYESTMVVFSFFGFIGFVFFYIFFRENIKFKHLLFSFNLFTLIFFLPNIHFWSSSFGKGSLIFCGFGLFMFAILKPIPRFWALASGGWIIFQIRPHIFFVIAVAAVVSYAFSSKQVSKLYRFLILAAGVFVIYYIYDDIIKLTGLEDESIFDPLLSHRASQLTKATSGIDITNYSFPEKVFAFWFRPLFFDAPGALGFIVSFENAFYLFLFINFLRPKALRYLWRSEPIVRTALFTFLGVSFALAQISGNLGLAMRQKSQVMILMMFVIIKFMDDEKLHVAMRRLRRSQYLKKTSSAEKP